MAKSIPAATHNAILLCMFFAAHSVCFGDEFDIYLLAGQSNMDGRGRISNLAEDQKKPVGNTIIFYRNATQSSDGWQPLAPGFSVPPKYKGGFPSPTFGPEIGFARAMLKRQPKRKIALIKASKGGTSLRIDWMPGVKDKKDSQGPQYRDFVEAIRLATKQLRERGDQFKIRGLLWHQGESDAKSSTEVFCRRLKRLIARIREDVGVRDLPIVIGEVFDNGKRDTVRAAIQAVATESLTVGLVTSDGTTTWDQGTHFDAKSQLILGERFASAMSRLQLPNRGRAPEKNFSDELQPTMKDIRYGKHPRQKLHFWKVKSVMPTSVAIHIHGGGWNGGERLNRNLRSVLPHLLKANISVASVEYRLIKHAVSEGIDPPVKGPLSDCARAVQFVRSNAKQLNINTNQVAVFGGSAGGCTSLWLAFHDDLADPKNKDPVARESTRPNVVATIRAQTTLDPLQMKQWIPNGYYGGHAFGVIEPNGKPNRAENIAKFLAHRDELLPTINRYSPFALASGDDPPVYLWYSAKPLKQGKISDPTHSTNYGVKLQEHLNQLGVKSELVYPGAPGIVHKSIADYLTSHLK